MYRGIEDFALTVILLIGFACWQVLGILSQPPPDNTVTDRKAGGDARAALPDRAAKPPCDENDRGDKQLWSGIAEPGSDVARGLAAICSLDRAFDPRDFLRDASAAYEAIVMAYARSNLGLLQSLVSRTVYDTLVSAMTERVSRGEHLDLVFVGLNRADIKAAAVQAETAQITVRFSSQVVMATRAKDGAILSGDPKRIVAVNELWTFARDLRSPEPDWKLVATDSA